MEFALILGTIILPLVAITLTLGRVLWQINYISDVAREGARAGTLYSDMNLSASCSSLVSTAQSSMNNAMAATSRWGMGRVWGGAQASIGTRRSVTLGTGTASFKVITATVSTNTTERCLFCFSNILRGRYNISVAARQDINALSACMNEP